MPIRVQGSPHGGSYVSAEGADVSNSGYYGAQAAHGGTLSFRNGIANNCFRHGIRATDATYGEC